jgi:allophanate hydrolase
LTPTVRSIVQAHRNGSSKPEDTIATTYQRIRAYNDPAVFISLRDEADARGEAQELAGRDGSELPLFGVPVAVKDNVDVAGLSTTAACPAYAYMPNKDATAVALLRAAGAIVIGKTNLDQFATGLVGTRSPYGIPRNTLDRRLIPGGSSSGSAVAVAAGLVPIALGTDTAGSGRLPAMLNNIVGLKPSLGLISTTGVVPACRTLDCISVFSLTVDDAMTVLHVIGKPDPTDAYSRRRPIGPIGAFPRRLRLGVPPEAQLQFFGDTRSAAAYQAAVRSLAELGAQIVEFDIQPYYETARLLYEGPWVAERYLTARQLIETNPDALHPVTREITMAGRISSAADTFAAFYRLEASKRIHERTFDSIDAMVLPTAPTVYTVDVVLANPIELNSRLGTYTNFVNLLDMCGLAVPSAIHDDGTPFGITLLARGGHDAVLAAIGRAFHARSSLPLGALGIAQAPLPERAPTPMPDEIEIAVVGAHLSGMALNGELRNLGGRLLDATQTAPDYRLHALNGTIPPKPGMLRVAAGAGTKIAVETWALSAAGFGQFVAAIPAPLSIGTVKLADGREVKGFLVEPAALEGARDISEFGGWRAYVSANAKT